MEAVALKAAPRTRMGRSEVKKLRADGGIPAVLYGKGIDPAAIEISGKDFDRLVQHSVSENVLVDLTVDGGSGAAQLALVQEVEHHPLTGDILHVDFHKVSADEEVTVSVPIETHGEAVGVKTSGGTLEHVLFRTKVKALPKNLPAVISIDVTDLEAGHILHLGEIPLPEGVEVLGAKDIPVVTITKPRVKAADDSAEEEGGKEAS